MHADETEEPPGAVSNQMPEEGEAPHDESEGMNRRPPDSEPEDDADDEGAAGVRFLDMPSYARKHLLQWLKLQPGEKAAAANSAR